MADLSKIGDKLGLQKIINDMKSIISPVVIPEANKDNPRGYYLSELSKASNELAEHHLKQADIIARISNLLGSLHQEITGAKKDVVAETVRDAAVSSDDVAKVVTEQPPAAEIKSDE